MSSNIEFFTKLNTDVGGDIYPANGKKITAQGSGEGYIRSNGKQLKILNVLYVPDLDGNLLSVAKMVQNNIVILKNKKCEILKNGIILVTAKLIYIFWNNPR